MRIVSLLPSATEIVDVLGLHSHLVGVSHECDFPQASAALPKLTRARIDSTQSSAAIDQQVREAVAQGLSIYDIDHARLQALAPSLVVTQDTCQVCAVSLSDVELSLARLLGQKCTLVALSPKTLDDVFADIVRVGAAAQVEDRAKQVVMGLRQRLSALSHRVMGVRRPRVLFLEWFAPPMPAGHWTPDLMHLAGAEVVLSFAGRPTTTVSWRMIHHADPDVIIVGACGFDVPRTRVQARDLANEPGWLGLRAVARDQVYFCDGNAYFNRPGPRLVDSAEVLAALLHPDRVPSSFAHGGVVRWSDILRDLRSS